MSNKQEQKTAKDRARLNELFEQARNQLRADGKFSEEHNAPTAIVTGKPVIYFRKGRAKIN